MSEQKINEKQNAAEHGVTEQNVTQQDVAQHNVAKKGSEEFKAACKQYLQLFFDTKQDEYIKRGIWEFGENKDKCLGLTSKRILEAKLPMPFGCPDLFIQPCIDDKGKLTGVVWFCDRIGCICSCCREDLTAPNEEYPIYCPERLTPFDGYCDCGSSTCDICNPDWEDEEWLEEMESEDYYDA